MNSVHVGCPCGEHCGQSICLRTYVGSALSRITLPTYVNGWTLLLSTQMATWVLRVAALRVDACCLQLSQVMPPLIHFRLRISFQVNSTRPSQLDALRRSGSFDTDQFIQFNHFGDVLILMFKVHDLFIVDAATQPRQPRTYIRT